MRASQSKQDTVGTRARAARLFGLYGASISCKCSLRRSVLTPQCSSREGRGGGGGGEGAAAAGAAEAAALHGMLPAFPRCVAEKLN